MVIQYCQVKNLDIQNVLNKEAERQMPYHWKKYQQNVKNQRQENPQHSRNKSRNSSRVKTRSQSKESVILDGVKQSDKLPPVCYMTNEVKNKHKRMKRFQVANDKCVQQRT